MTTTNNYIRMTRYISLLLLMAIHSRLALAQDTIPAALKEDLYQYGSKHLQEKLYVHTDKEFYLAGEICWFKIYVVEAGSHHPLDLSKVASLEWLDRNNKPVLQTRTRLNKGHGSGSLFLPLTLRSGNYTLRAYTSWMKNDGEDWLFEKSVTIVNARGSAESPVAVTPLRYDVAFFPEGGNMVDNITGKIAYKISDQYGRGASCTGVITEDDQDTVAHFQPQKFGIGTFMLTPRPGHRYRSTIRLADGTAISQLLPAAWKEGMVMSVSNEDNDHIRINIQSTTSDDHLYIIAHTRQSVKVAETALLREGKASILIDRNSLGEGISQLTLFNAARQAIAERLVFRSPSHNLHIDLGTDQGSYATRSRINLQVNATGADSHPCPADLSLSVFRMDSLQSAPVSDITGYLYLTSDLKGHIESPEYYLQHPEDVQAIDNLMISHGWRRFRWEDVLHHSSPALRFPPEYNGPIVTGSVTDTRTNKAAKGILTYLSAPGTRTLFAAVYSDNEGQVRFAMPDLYDAREVIVQTNPNWDSMYRVDIDPPFLERYTHVLPAPFMLSAGYAGALADKSVATQVMNKLNGIRMEQLRFPAVDTNTFYYKADHSYLLDDYTRFTTMEEVLREYVTLMLVKKKNGHFHLPVYDFQHRQVFENDPLILLDGVPVFDIDKLMTLDPLKIRRLEVIQRKYFFGAAAFDGILNWTTYKGDLGGYTLDPHATVVDYEGLQLDREFYAPSYAEGQAPESHLPDFRNVLYWTPTVPIGPSGKSSLDFYSSDIPGKYVVFVEGLAPDGATGSRVTTFEVRTTSPK